MIRSTPCLYVCVSALTGIELCPTRLQSYKVPNKMLVGTEIIRRLLDAVYSLLGSVAMAISLFNLHAAIGVC